MRNSLITSCLIVLLVMASLPSAVAQSYSVTNLGTPAGFTLTMGNYALAHGINNSGAVAGEWSFGGFSQRAFEYANVSNTDLGMLGGPSATIYAIAYAINDTNLVVGETSSFLSTRAFLYTNDMMVDLTPVGGTSTYSIARGINSAGKIVGESYVNTTDIHAVIFLGNRLQTDLGILTNGTYSAAYGINNSNVIVGEATVSAGNTYAFIYSNSLMTSLGTLGGNYSAAFAINDSGQIVGEANTSGGETHAFLYNNGTMSNLGTLGGTSSSASAINSAGRVVGYATTVAGDSRAFLYAGSTMLDLNNLISSAVCTNLTSADGINDAGQIAATGYTPTGDLRAFLLTPVLKVTAPQLLPNQQFQLTVQGAPGQKFIVHGSTNLVNWVPLNTNTLVAISTNWVDAGTVTNHYRFYRVQATQ